MFANVKLAVRGATQYNYYYAKKKLLVVVV